MSLLMFHDVVSVVQVDSYLNSGGYCFTIQGISKQ